MGLRLPTHLAVTALVVSTACATGAPDAGTGGGWVGTITTAGNVTTVVNESGSVWGGEARLVEEASIGVEVGADAYMLGAVPSVWATHERLVVVDSQIPAVRVYDLDGNHLFDVGRGGEGPGEFRDPGGVAVTSNGDILVVEASLQIEVFGADGAPKTTRNAGGNTSIYGLETLLLGADDVPWVRAIDSETRRLGWARIGADGSAGEPLFPPETGWESPCLTYMENGREDQYCNIPFQPRAVGELTAEGAWAVGTTDNYAFQVHKPDGSILRVQRYWTPVAVSAAEADYHKRRTTAYIREDDPSWNWNGPEIPDHKPAYLQLLPARDGRLWVLREGPSRESTDCLDEEPECWVPEGYWLDAFGPDGRFLGSVTLDRRPSYRPFIADTTIVAIVTDDAGTIMVKRYRLLLPA
jgi:hypothetical protein